MLAVIIDIETIPRPIPEDEFQAYEAEVREDLVQEHAIKKRLERFKYDWGKKPHQAQPVCIGWKFGDEEAESLCSEDEREIAQQYHAIIRDAKAREIHKVCGFNIKAFDLPVLAISSAKITGPTHPIHPRHEIIDLIEEPIGREIGMKSLNWYLRQFGIPAKTGNGSDVAALWRHDQENGTEFVAEYCRADVEKTWELLLRLSRVYRF